MTSNQRFIMYKALLVVAMLLLLSSSLHADGPSNTAILMQLHNIESTMDTSIEPCENFYEYACGNYPNLMANSKYPEIITTLHGKFLKSVQQILTDQYPNVRQLKHYNQNFTDKLQIYLHSCREQNGAVLSGYLENITPGMKWPFIEEIQVYHSSNGTRKRQPWSTHKFDLFGLLGKLFSVGLNRVIIAWSPTKVKGSKRRLITVPSTSDFSADDISNLLSRTVLPSEIKDRYYREILETHQKWQAIYQQYADNTSEDEYSFDEIRQKSPQLAKFLQEFLPHRAIESDEIFVVGNFKYFNYLATLQWQPADAEKLCNYLMFSFKNLLVDTGNMENCVHNALRRMHLAVNYIYYKHSYLQIAENERLSDIIDTIYKHFLALIAENQLGFNEQQMREIMTKVHNMTTNIGNIPQNVTESMVEEFYSYLPDMDMNNYHKNELALRKQVVRDSFECPANIICDNVAYGSPLNVINRNFVMLPFSSLMAPMYHSEYDDLMSLSLLGNSLGHEFAHAISPKSLNSQIHFTTFNSNSCEQYGVRTAVECLQQQAPATKYIDERIADVVGAQLAYRAYSHEYGVQPNYTTIPWQQLFFLNMAQFFCYHKDPDFMEYDNNTVRLHHIVMNSEEFSQAFQCSRDSKMNPAKKCCYI